MDVKRPFTYACLAVGSFGLGIHALSNGTKSEPTVLLFLSTDCPIAAQYTPRINSLFNKYAGDGVQFKALFPNDLETKPSIDIYMSERSYKFPSVLDLGAQQAKSLGVTATPTAVVLDAQGHEIYRGAIDDNPNPALARKQYLDSAIADALKGTKPRPSRTAAFGCALMPSAAAPAVGRVNYASHIEPILQAHCVSCHRPGEVAPFSLIGYVNARKWAPMIARVTNARQMPPWKAVHGYGEFKNDDSLSETEIETLNRWNEAGAPKGSLGAENLNVPPVPEWPLGQPDLILQTAKQFRISADGVDLYRNFVIHTHFTEPMYVTALDVKPGNRRVVHHVLAFVDVSGRSDKLLARETDGQEGYTGNGAGPGFFPDTTLGGWVPGARREFLPKGTAFLLKPGANIVVQVHYHKDGKQEEDQTRLGLYFAKSKPDKIMNIAWMVNPMISIPAGDAHHVERLNYNIRRDITIYAVMAHMHLLGKSMKADVVFPDGHKEPLVFVDNWDFQWQLTYALKEPMKVPAGSKIEIEAVYNNSASNPNNPNNPPKLVTWGEQTTDEMLVMTLAETADNQVP